MTFKLGRVRPTRRPHDALRALLPAALPPAPPSVPYSSAAGLADVLGNDSLGDCTSAGAGHILTALRAAAGDGLPAATAADAIAFYSLSTGYNPADPATDQGGDEMTVLEAWRDKGYFANGSGKIGQFVSVNGADEDEIKQAIWLFGAVYFGVELPDAWVSPMPSADGFVWDVAGDADPANGHCFVGLGYNDAGVAINSWGLRGLITWGAIAKYATTALQGELYAVFATDEIRMETGEAPNGLAAETLAGDLTAV